MKKIISLLLLTCSLYSCNLNNSSNLEKNNIIEEKIIEDNVVNISKSENSNTTFNKTFKCWDYTLDILNEYYQNTTEAYYPVSVKIYEKDKEIKEIKPEISNVYYNCIENNLKVYLIWWDGPTLRYSSTTIFEWKIQEEICSEFFPDDRHYWTYESNWEVIEWSNKPIECTNLNNEIDKLSKIKNPE